jgi:hypothetical protein
MPAAIHHTYPTQHHMHVMLCSQLTLDGYSAPITAGNFIANVLDGRYDGRSVVMRQHSSHSAFQLVAISPGRVQ